MIKQDVINVIERKSTVKVPVWYDYFAAETKEKYGRKIDQLIEKYPDDLLVCLLPEQNWGIKYEHAIGGVGTHAVYNPLADWDDYCQYYEKYFPDPLEPGLLDLELSILVQS